MSDGERFPQLMDRLIRATGVRFGIKQRDIQTQLRVNVTDGGVDTAVDVPMPGCDTGWFDVPTCWQFKAQPASAIDAERISTSTQSPRRGRRRTKLRNELQEEINKPHVAELIKRGYAYRLCILGDLTDENVKEWEEQLNLEARKINADAATVKVVHGGFLPNWIERYPAIIPWLTLTDQPAVLRLESWGRNITRDLPNYVPNSEWRYAWDDILRHCDFANVTRSPCLRIGGPAGVGKSRLVYEALISNPAASALVIYAADEQEAKRLSANLANEDVLAWLVADECSESALNYLNQNLKGVSNRVRVVCINNTKPITESGQIWLQPPKNIVDVLSRNYGDRVSLDRCRKYAALSKGFLRFASDMCEHHDQIESGDFGNLTGSVEAYVRDRFGKWLEVASLIALFRILGFDDDVASEVEAIAKMSGITLRDFHQMVHDLKDSPGFVAKQGRYRYITPDIVARTIYGYGWNRYVSGDLKVFVENLPEALVQPFLDRAAELGGEEVRAQVADTFQTWASELTVQQLQNAKVCNVLRALIETKPDQYLPRLKFVLSRSSDDEVRLVGEDYARPSARRILVWMLESLVAFPEYFDDCEECLFALSRGENEHQIGNNATHTWADLFSINLSGSAAPFDMRFNKLKSRLSCGEHIPLCVIGLTRAFLGPSSKIVGPPSIAGRIRPESWRPMTTTEHRNCLELALSTVPSLMASGSDETKEVTFQLIQQVDHFLLSAGMFSQLMSSLNVAGLNELQRRALIKSLEEYLDYEKSEQSEYNDRIRDFINELTPKDFTGRLRSVVSRDPWDDRHEQTDELHELSQRIVADPRLLDGEFMWLETEEAKSLELLGSQIAKLDVDGAIGKLIVDRVMATGLPGLLRGYIRCALPTVESSAEFISAIDRLQQLHPIATADAIRYGGDALNPLERTLNLFSSGVVSAFFLSSFAYSFGRRQLSEFESLQILSAIIGRESTTYDGSVGAALKFITSLLHSKKELLNSTESKKLCWSAVEMGSRDPKRRDAYELDLIVEWLFESNIERAFKLYSQWMVSDDFDLNEKGSKRLAQFATQYPGQAMRAFGEALLNKQHGYRLHISIEKEVVNSLPPEVVVGWVEEHGEGAAKAIARHLPLPFRSETGSVIVPITTLAVLEKFPSDEVIDAFATSTLDGTWWGNAAERFRNEAAIARELLAHPSEPIRKWSKSEFEFKTKMALREDLEEEEHDLPL